MSWFIGRTEALTNPEKARRKALERLRGIAELDDPESLVVPILIDAILMAESYRGARHQVSFLPELTRNVDALLRELNPRQDEGMGGLLSRRQVTRRRSSRRLLRSRFQVRSNWRRASSGNRRAEFGIA